jgi:choline-sulfatase
MMTNTAATHFARTSLRASKWLWPALLLSCQSERAERRPGLEPGVAPGQERSSTSVESARPSPQQPSAAQQPASPQQPSSALARPREALNVLLITVQAWRADMPWLASSTRDVAPQLTRWIKESVLWENHRAVSSHTPQSLAALMSGRLPSTLYRDGALFPTYAVDNVFVPEVLQAKGIRTLGVHADAQQAATAPTALRQGKGFEQGFDVWESLAGGGATEPTSERASTRLMTLLGQPPNTAGQFFAWLHLDDPQEPYLPAPQVSFGSSPRDRYDAEIRNVDDAVGKLLEHARQQPWWSRTAVIITGSHGEALGEHGLSRHGQELWDVLLKTPLIIRAPGAAPARLSVARSQIDLAPTILELMGLPQQEQHLGQSLLPELYGSTQEQRAVQLFELCEDVENPGLRAMIAGDEKLIVPGNAGAERLYDLKADPGESKDLAESEGARLRAMAVRFEGEWGRVPAVEPHGGMKLRSGRLAQGPSAKPGDTERPNRSP